MSSNNYNGSECCYKQTLKDKIKNKFRDLKYKFSTDRFRYWLIKYVLTKLLNIKEHYCSDTHIFREMQLAGWTNKEKIDNIKFLVNVHHLLDKFGCISTRDWKLVSESFPLLSPLKFTDDEFGDTITDRIFDYRQNNRRCSVFKYGTDDFRDVDAIIWTMKARYDLSNNPEHNLIGEYGLAGHHTHCWMYNEKDDSWIKVGNGHKINTLRNYYGKSFSVPFIEIYDSEDKDNDYYCNIANLDSIPSEFYKWFILTEVDNYNDSDKEELAFLKDNDMKQMLFKPVIDSRKINNIIINDAKILIEVSWVSDKEAVIEALISEGISENSIKVSYSDNNISLIIPTTEENRSIISRIANQFNYKEKENGKQ